MKKFTVMLIVLLLMTAMQVQGQAQNWSPSKSWIRIDAALFIALSGWTGKCRVNCYPVYHTHHKEEVGYYINTKTRKIASVVVFDTPSIRMLSR